MTKSRQNGCKSKIKCYNRQCSKKNLYISCDDSFNSCEYCKKCRNRCDDWSSDDCGCYRKCDDFSCDDWSEYDRGCDRGYDNNYKDICRRYDCDCDCYKFKVIHVNEPVVCIKGDCEIEVIRP